MEHKHKNDILARLKSVEGHLRGIQRMVEEDAYCMDIIQQSRAVQHAMHKIDALMLENHLNTCVITAIRTEDGDERERVIGELMDVFQAQAKT